MGSIRDSDSRYAISFKFEHSDGAPTVQIRESQMWIAMNGDFRTSDIVSV